MNTLLDMILRLLLAAALGAPDKDLMLHMQFVQSQKLIQKAGANGK